MEKTIIVKNTSPHTDVIVTAGSIDPHHIELPRDSNVPLLRSSQSSLTVSGGCIKLYVWGMDLHLLWCGIVPTDTSHSPIIIDPDTKRVEYLEMLIPECQEILPPRIGPPLRENFGSPPPDTTFLKVIITLLVILSVCAIIMWLRN